MSISPAQSKPPGFSLGSLLTAVAARWKLVTLVAVPIGLAVAAGTWVGMPAEYTARATVRCRFTTTTFLEPAKPLEKDTVAALQREMLATLRSPQVMNKAVTADGVRDLPTTRSQPDPAGWLNGRLRAGFSDDTEYLSLSLTGLAPRDQAEVLNALTQAFGAELNERARKRQLDDGNRLDKAIGDTRSQALKQREELARMLGGIKSRDPNDPRWQFDLAMAASLNTDLVKVRGELRRQKELSALLNAQLPEVESMPSRQQSWRRLWRPVRRSRRRTPAWQQQNWRSPGEKSRCPRPAPCSPRWRRNWRWRGRKRRRCGRSRPNRSPRNCGERRRSRCKTRSSAPTGRSPCSSGRRNRS